MRGAPDQVWVGARFSETGISCFPDAVGEAVRSVAADVLVPTEYVDGYSRVGFKRTLSDMVVVAGAPTEEPISDRAILSCEIVI